MQDRLPARWRLNWRYRPAVRKRRVLPLDAFARFSQNPAYPTQLSQPIGTVMLALNTAKAPTNELAVREALNYAVNKKSLIDNALYGTQQVADTLLPLLCLTLISA
ncbi:ABC transporter substrate-binding protein [Escherichia coli]